MTFGFVTSESSLDMRRRAYDAGAQFLIGKPFGADDFREVLGPVAVGGGGPGHRHVAAEREGRAEPARDAAGPRRRGHPGRPVEVGPLDPAHVAVYVDDRTRMVATAVADLPLAVHCGAALGLTPRRSPTRPSGRGSCPRCCARTSTRCSTSSPPCSTTPGAPHVRLHSTFAPGERLPADVDAVVHTVGRRLDLHVDVAAYGAGRLGLVLAP